MKAANIPAGFYPQRHSLPIRLLKRFGSIDDSIARFEASAADVELLNRAVGTIQIDLCGDEFTLVRALGLNGIVFSRTAIDRAMDPRAVTIKWPWVESVFEHEYHLTKFLAYAYHARESKPVLLLENAGNRRGRQAAVIAWRWDLRHDDLSRQPMGDCRLFDLDAMTEDDAGFFDQWIEHLKRARGVRAVLCADDFDRHRERLKRIEGLTVLVRLSERAAFNSQGLDLPRVNVAGGAGEIVKFLIQNAEALGLRRHGRRAGFVEFGACFSLYAFENLLTNRICLYRHIDDETGEPSRLKQFPRGMASEIMNHPALVRNLPAAAEGGEA